MRTIAWAFVAILAVVATVILVFFALLPGLVALVLAAFVGGCIVSTDRF